uniref:Uncharacterized protein n=1 Tax=Anguilla anguilla TaxID=7936 RepID=A0A0E9PGH5_ANGAN
MNNQGQEPLEESTNTDILTACEIQSESV